MSPKHTQKAHKARKTLSVKKSVRPKLIDRLTYLAAIIEPLFSLPQAIEIFHNKSAGSVSILSWIGFQIMTSVWIWYAVVHKEKMLFIYQSLYFVIDGLVLIGAIYFGGRLL